MQNLGAYLQGTWYPLEALGVTLNVRDDEHNIYGHNLSTRAGLVYRLSEAWTAKALYGTSFKAPSPLQLFGKPLIFGDILGNPDLKPEYAHTLEGAIVYAPAAGVDLTGNVYYTHVSDQISFETLGGNPYAVNLGQSDSAGLEAAFNWKWRFLHGALNTSLQKTVPTLESGYADPAGVLPPYPFWMANAGLGAPLWKLPIHVWAEARYVGWVPSSQQNFAANGHEPYQLAPAFVADLTFTNSELYLINDHPTNVTLQISNLFNATYAYPGYGGVDYPGLGRTVALRLGQSF
jgi:iron complex outermembrane receptor protein